MSAAIRGVYALLDLPHAGGMPAVRAARALVDGGANVLQLRAKAASTAKRIEILHEIAPLCRRAGVPLVVNDDLEAALSGVAGIWGLHLGQQDLADSSAGSARWSMTRQRLESAGLAWGLSTHDIDQVSAAAEFEPSYVGFGPVHFTRSKSDLDPVTGTGELAKACAASRLPVVAIGGIDHGNARACIDAGAVAVAVISCLVAPDAGSVSKRTRELLDSISDRN